MMAVWRGASVGSLPKGARESLMHHGGRSSDCAVSGTRIRDFLTRRRGFSDGGARAAERPLAMLSTTADYALRAALFLGRHYGSRVVPADEIADAIGAPRGDVSKTLN